jgi:flagellar hook assembly protein FlgD
MTIWRIINGVTAVREDAAPIAVASHAPLSVFSPRGARNTFIEFMLPSGHRAAEASVELYSMKGALVKKLLIRVAGAVNHVSWDNRDASGSLVPQGMYVVRVVSGAVNLSTQCAIMR